MNRQGRPPAAGGCWGQPRRRRPRVQPSGPHAAAAARAQRPWHHLRASGCACVWLASRAQAAQPRRCLAVTMPGAAQQMQRGAPRGVQRCARALAPRPATAPCRRTHSRIIDALLLASGSMWLTAASDRGHGYCDLSAQRRTTQPSEPSGAFGPATGSQPPGRVKLNGLGEAAAGATDCAPAGAHATAHRRSSRSCRALVKHVHCPTAHHCWQLTLRLAASLFCTANRARCKALLHAAQSRPRPCRLRS